MDYKKINPCSAEVVVRLLAWAETDCWCCTSLRSGLVFGIAGVVLGLLLGGKFMAAFITAALGGPIVYELLKIARVIWKDDTDSTDSKG